MSTKPGLHQRVNLATKNSIDGYALMNPPTDRSVCGIGGGHHWILEAPSGLPTCRGECKKCRAVREDFRTSSDDTLFPVDARGEGEAFARRAAVREARKAGAA
jgi:hypothetical protein